MDKIFGSSDLKLLAVAFNLGVLLDMFLSMMFHYHVLVV